jgi:hypothetical protein
MQCVINPDTFERGDHGVLVNGLGCKHSVRRTPENNTTSAIALAKTIEESCRMTWKITSGGLRCGSCG